MPNTGENGVAGGRIGDTQIGGPTNSAASAPPIGDLPTQLGAVSRTDATLAADAPPPRFTALGRTDFAADSLGSSTYGDDDDLLERGALIDRYVVLGRLGAGGMGVVYAAYDPELDRKVAVKLLRAAAGIGTAASPGRTRLLREAQALAKLSHPHVVAIHDVGTHGERVWLAMEYVDGVTLGAWIAERRPPWFDVLAVLRRVGEGLAAAHAAGLVHRDLKPDNIMIGHDGRVRVMDFGLARAAGNFDPEPGPAVSVSVSQSVMALPVTQVGAIMGTPAYMAPEQWRGELADARADQFSFCVTLWEALYGARPFAGDTATNLAVAVLAGELHAPPRGTPVPGWLRRTLARGLQTDPARRFDSMDALLAALVDGEARKRRRRVALVVALLVLSIAAVPASLHWRRGRRIAACDAEGNAITSTWNPDAAAALTAALTTSNLSYATTTAAKVTPWLDAWAGAWSTARAQVCREATVERTRPPDLHAGAVACLDERRDEFAALLDVLREGGADAVPRAVPAAANLTSPSSCTDRAALDHQHPLPDDPALQASITDLRREAMRVQGMNATGRTEAGLAAAEALLTRAEALGHDPLTVRIRLRVGELAEKRGRLDLAERELIRTYVDAGAIGADDIAAAAAIQLVYFTGHTRAKYDAAIQWSHPAELLVRRLGRTDDLLGARLDNALAITHKDHGDFDAAEALYKKIIATRERILGPEHPDVASSLGNLVNLLEARGTTDEALILLRRSLAILEPAYGADHPTIAQLLNNLGGAYIRRDRLGEALPLQERALAIREQVYGPNHAEVAMSLLNIALIKMQRDDLEGARVLTERGLRIRESVYGPEHPLVSEATGNLAAIRLHQKALDDAQKLAERALAIDEKIHGVDHPDVAYSVYNLADIAHARGDLESARALFDRVVAIREKRLDANSRDLAEARIGLADVHVERNDPKSARPLIDRALAVLDPTTEDSDSLTLLALRVAADTARLERDHPAAQALYERTLAADPTSCGALVGLGHLALDRDQPQAAIPWFERALTACTDDPTPAREGLERARRPAIKR